MRGQFQHIKSVSELTADQILRIEKVCSENGQAYDSLLNTEMDREIFLMPELPGVISFCRINQDAEMLGGICAPESAKETLLGSFVSFLKSEGLALSTFNVPEADVKYFRELQFRTTKLGEELYLDLLNHSWQGKKFWKFRTKINKCAKAGMVVRELVGDHYEERKEELALVTQAQLAEKTQNNSLKFFVGQCPPAQLGLRRVFVCEDSHGEIDAFVVLLPFSSNCSLGLDSFRIRPGGTRNAMLFLLKEVVDQLRDEGIKEFSLGAVPGSNCKESIPGDKAVIRKFVSFTYDYLGFIYDLKGVDEFKSQFRPLRRNLYLSCYPDQFTINGVYAFFKTFGMFDFSLKKAVKRLLQKWTGTIRNYLTKSRRVYNG